VFEGVKGGQHGGLSAENLRHQSHGECIMQKSYVYSMCLVFLPGTMVIFLVHLAFDPPISFPVWQCAPLSQFITSKHFLFLSCCLTSLVSREFIFANVVLLPHRLALNLKGDAF